MDRVKVFLRVKEGAKENELSFTETSLLDQSYIYEFDKIFYGRKQEQVYESIGPMVRSALSGYNLAVFAYGQTGSGKTYTMEGTKDSPGVILRALADVFGAAPQRVAISAIEIYNEKVFDLLAPENPIQVRESKEGVLIDSLTQTDCASKEAALAAFELASGHRKTENNGTNALSSRSHMIFTVSVEQLVAERVLHSKITLVDLAGSEKTDASDSGHPVKRRRPEKSLETANINKSLLYLSRIIHTLSSSSGRHKHINYRDSKLTFILRDSLNGSSCLAVIGTVNPENPCETKHTLGFLAAAKEIKLAPQPSDRDDRASKLLAQVAQLASENARLKEELAAQSAQPGAWDSVGADQRLAAVDRALAQLEALVQQVAALKSSTEQTAAAFSASTAQSNALQQRLFAALCAERDAAIEAVDLASA